MKSPVDSAGAECWRGLLHAKFDFGVKLASVFGCASQSSAGQLAALLLDLVFKLHPIAFDRVLVHGVFLKIWIEPPWFEAWAAGQKRSVAMQLPTVGACRPCA